MRALNGDRAGALESLGRAIELNGSYAPAHHWRANVLAEMGQLEAALADAERAASLDPLSVAIATDYAYILLWSGDVDAADAQFQQAIRTDFGSAKAQFGAALVGLEQGEQVTVHMGLAQWAAVAGLPMGLAPELADGMLAFQGTGRAGTPPASLAGLVEDQRLSAGAAAALAALVGAQAETLTWLRRSVDDRSWVDQFLAVNTIYDPYRGDPAFQAVLEQVSAP